MIHKIILPKLSANMEKGIIGKWLKKEGERVKKGEPLFELSTDKAVFEVEVEESGFLRKILAREGEELPILCVVGIIAAIDEKLPSLEELKKPPTLKAGDQETRKTDFVIKEEKPKVCPVVKVSPRAKKIAKDYNINFNLIEGTGPEGRVIEKDVENYLSSQKERVLILGGWRGGMTLIDILKKDRNKVVVGVLDDDSELWEKEIMGVKILGPLKLIDQLKDRFDSLVISFTEDMEARKKVFVDYKNKGYKFINIIHPKALIEDNVQLGKGNLIYPFVRIGPFSKVGDNNLISAFTNIEHHNEVGSHNHFGPNCSTSGGVKIGDSCKFGTGIFVENDISIGDNVKVASGSIIINDISSNSFLRTKIIQKPAFK